MVGGPGQIDLKHRLVGVKHFARTPGGFSELTHYSNGPKWSLSVTPLVTLSALRC